MKLDRFLAYLKYRNCEEEQIRHGVYSIYRNRDTGEEASIGTRTAEIPSKSVVLYCLSLGIPAPDVDDIKDIEQRLGKVWS